MADTVVAVNDSVPLRATGEDDNGYVETGQWSFDAMASWTDAADSVVPHVWPVQDTGAHRVYVKVLDNDGVTSDVDSVVVNVVAYYPAVQLQCDSTVWSANSVSLVAVAHDSNGTIEQYVWAVVGTALADTTDSPGHQLAFSTNGPRDIVVTVIDDDGLSADDTATVVVGSRILYDGNMNSSGYPPIDTTLHVAGDTVTVLDNIGSLTHSDTNLFFARWSTDTGASGDEFVPGGSVVMDSTDMLLYAVWERGFRVTYHANGATGGEVPVVTTLYPPGSTATIAGNTGSLVSSDSLFSHWSTQPTETGTTYAESTTVQLTSDLVLYARFVYVAPPDSLGPRLQVSSPADGDTVTATVVQLQGTVTDPDGVLRLEVNDSTVIVGAAGAWSTTVELPGPGPHDISLLALDSADYTTYDTLRLVVDLSAQNSVNLDSGLVAYYPLDGDAQDHSGAGRHGTLTGAMPCPNRQGIPATACIFDGIDDYGTIPNLSGHSSYTQSVWFRCRTVGTNNTLLSTEDGVIRVNVVSADSMLYYTSVHGRAGIGPQNHTTEYGNHKVALGRWNHAVVIAAADSLLSLYLNGVLVNEEHVTDGGNVSALTGSFIGRRTEGIELFRGEMDEVRVYDRILTATEVDSLCREAGLDWQSSQAPFLIAEYRFAGNAQDGSGNGYDGTVTGPVLTTDRFGAAASAYQFDGVDDYINLGTVPAMWFDQPDSRFSIAAWVRVPTSLPATGQRIMCRYDANGNDRAWSLGLDDKRPELIASADGSFTADSIVQYQLPASDTLTSSTWHHVAAVWDVGSDEYALYIDGAPQSGTHLKATALSAVHSSNAQVLIGALGPNPTPGEPFVGAIDDIAVFSGALSAAQVDSLYRVGDLDWQIPAPQGVNLDSGLVAHYPFNGDATDQSGNGEHATVNGAVLTADRYGTPHAAYSFDGTDDFIEGTNVISAYEEASLSVWVHSTTIPINVVRGIVSKPRHSSGGGFRIGLNADVGDADVGFNNAVVNLGPRTGDTVADGTWHHLVATVGGGVARIYLDGVVADSTDPFTPTGITSSENLQIGREMPAGEYRYVQASIDDIRVYDRPLREVEIDSLYREGGLSWQAAPRPDGGYMAKSGFYAQTATMDLCSIFPGGPFTMEFWVYPDSAYYSAGMKTEQAGADERRFHAILSPTPAANEGISWMAAYYPFHPAVQRVQLAPTDTLPRNRWSHVAAVVDDGPTARIFINGEEKLAIGGSGSVGCGTAGRTHVRSTGAFIDNLRISSVARYTGSFTPPTSYVNDSSTSILLPFDALPATDTLTDETGNVTYDDAGNAVMGFVVEK